MPKLKMVLNLHSFVVGLIAGILVLSIGFMVYGAKKSGKIVGKADESPEVIATVYTATSRQDITYHKHPQSLRVSCSADQGWKPAGEFDLDGYKGYIENGEFQDSNLDAQLFPLRNEPFEKILSDYYQNLREESEESSSGGIYTVLLVDHVIEKLIGNKEISNTSDGNEYVTNMYYSLDNSTKELKQCHKYFKKKTSDNSTNL